MTTTFFPPFLLAYLHGPVTLHMIQTENRDTKQKNQKLSVNANSAGTEYILLFETRLTGREVYYANRSRGGSVGHL